MSKSMQRIALAPDYEISRVIRGGWQLASGHGAVKSDDPVADMTAFADAGTHSVPAPISAEPSQYTSAPAFNSRLIAMKLSLDLWLK